MTSLDEAQRCLLFDMRDALLPQLLSGEFEAPVFDAQAEEVA